MSTASSSKSSTSAPVSPPGTRNYVLKVTGGPAAGKEFVLNSPEVTLGRAVSADVQLPDMVISRHHTSIYFEGRRWVVKDLESTNGTWIGNRRVRGPTPLELGKTVRLGNSLFQVHQIDEPLDEPIISARVESVSVKRVGEERDAASAQIARDQKKLQAMYSVQRLVSAAGDLQEVYDCCLEIVTGAIPSQRAHLLLAAEDGNNLVPVAQRDERGPVKELSMENVSRSIIRWVRSQDEGVLSIDATKDVRFSSQSISDSQLQRVLCVPIHGSEEQLGVIHLAVKSINLDYAEDDLKLLSAIACSAGLAIENRRLMESNLAAERMAAVGLMAASLAHDVKNILGGLEGCISLLRMGLDSKDGDLTENAWDMMNRNQKRLNSLMHDLLNLASEDKHESLAVSVEELVREAVDVIRPQADANDIKIMVRKPAEFDGIAWMDSRGMHRVLLNLLTNAIAAINDQHVGTGKGRVRITWGLKEGAEDFFLRVRDNGKGIAVVDQSKVFNLFHTSKGNRGTGLGLSVCKQIVERHQGTIEVESIPGKGSEFIVTLPQNSDSTDTETRTFLIVD
ncbi:MAG TPA: hypothetical protein DCR55_12590 [Lentisphaeria bacterium]|nr:hypothetical protein [Lentisphaeria bacterium]